jgi:hypothetical protein
VQKGRIRFSTTLAERVIAGKRLKIAELHISNSDFWILAGIFSAIGGVGIYEGNELHPMFYSRPVIIFGGLGYLAYVLFYLDRKTEDNETSLRASSNVQS